MKNEFLFQVPEKFLVAYQRGTLDQVGGLLKDNATGKIVAHLQETGAAQSIVRSFTGVATNPIGFVFDTANMVQTYQANQKLTALQSAVGNLQILQVATAVTSLAGIGVTVASTAILLKRMNALQTSIGSLEEKVDHLPKQWEELKIRDTLRRINDQFERLDEAAVSKRATALREKAEESLHDAFSILADTTTSVLGQKEMDRDLLASLLAGLSLAGGAQTKVLYQLDEVERAQFRSRNQFQKILSISNSAPTDVLVQRLEPQYGNSVATFLKNMRTNTASQCELANQLVDRNISGQEYVERAAFERAEPIMLLPSVQNS